MLGSICQLVAYAIMTAAPPFPMLVFAYLIIGFALSLQVSVFCLAWITSVHFIYRYRMHTQMDSSVAFGNICQQN